MDGRTYITRIKQLFLLKSTKKSRRKRKRKRERGVEREREGYRERERGVYRERERELDDKNCVLLTSNVLHSRDHNAQRGRGSRSPSLFCAACVDMAVFREEDESFYQKTRKSSLCPRGITQSLP